MEIYKNPNMSVQDRVNDLLSKMTIKEKVGQLNQKIFGWNAYKINNGKVLLTKEFEDEVSFGDGLGAIYGISRADGWNAKLTTGITPKESIEVANAIQKYVIDNTRLGIPILISEECPHGHEALEGTTFPTNIGIGSTWNTELYEKVCSIIAQETRARGAHLGLISTLDIATDPRWGRTEECYSEDPYLAGCLCESAVKGLQGTDESQLNSKEKVISVVKHFCAQGATIGGHNGKSTNIGQRELHEIHLYGMKRAAKAGALGCMAAYNDIDGVPCHINRNLLTKKLRNELGFKGFVMSDGMGVDRLNEITGSYAKSGACSLYAGVDMNLWNQSFMELETAIEKNYIDENILDIAVGRILSIKFKLGLFENPYADESNVSIVNSQNAKSVALDIAREVPVLLKNNDILPLKSSYKQIAVIGPNSDDIYNMLGDYTQWQEDGKAITVLDGIKNHAPNNTIIHHSNGCSIRSKDKNEFPKAIESAKKSDIIILVLGGSSARKPNMEFEDNGAFSLDQFTSELDCGEAVDLADLNLGGVQLELAKELHKLNKPIITILIQGRPHAIPWFVKNSDAILCGWYPGEQGGNAIGEILFGKTVPSGKLSIGIPSSSAQLPIYYNRKDESRYIDMSEKPLYSFGYGLSYASFCYGDFLLNAKSLTKEELEGGKRFVVNFSIQNKSTFDAKETAQLYIYDIESCITRRIKELKDFKKILVPKSSSVNIDLSVGIDELSIYDYNMDFVLERGNVKLMVGTSSDNILFEEIVAIK